MWWRRQYCVTTGGHAKWRENFLRGQCTDGLRETVRENHRRSNAHDGCRQANGAAPTYCKVNGTIAPSLNFEIRLPDAWNGKLSMPGAGVTTD